MIQFKLQQEIQNTKLYFSSCKNGKLLKNILRTNQTKPNQILRSDIILNASNYVKIVRFKNS